MAKIISFFTAMFLILQSPFLFLFGTDGRALGKVTLVLEASSYAVGTQSITGTLHNGTFRSIPHDPGCQLEKWDDGEWSFMEPVIRHLYDHYLLRPLQSGSVNLDLTNYDPPLGPGRYRAGVGETYAEFTLV